MILPNGLLPSTAAPAHTSAPGIIIPSPPAHKPVSGLIIPSPPAHTPVSGLIMPSPPAPTPAPVAKKPSPAAPTPHPAVPSPSTPTPPTTPVPHASYAKKVAAHVKNVINPSSAPKAAYHSHGEPAISPIVTGYVKHGNSSGNNVSSSGNDTSATSGSGSSKISKKTQE